MKNLKTLCFLLMAIAITLVQGAKVQGAGAAVSAEMAARLAKEAERGGYRLIDTETLWQLYQEGQDSLVLVDTRQEWEYHSGHIRGARNFPFEPTWLSRLTNRGALEQFLGPDKNKTIVFY
ncbi:MAG: hypothetical protein Kow0089_07490 [Desulfobulbaceae bacterium]